MRIRFFKEEEFMCPCCGKMAMNKELIYRLEALRGLVNKPIIVTSGYRCEKHNLDVGGSKNSFHLRGEAVDIKCIDSLDRFLHLRYAFICGFNGIGISKNFLHLDIRDEIPVTFLYG